MSHDHERSDRMAAQVERAAKRLPQLQARRSLHQMRLATREKERARRAALSRQLELGGAVIAAGCGDVNASVLGAILKSVRDRSSQQRLSTNGNAI